MSMNEAESKPNVLLPLGVVGEKSFSDPTSDTWKNKKADRQWVFPDERNQWQTSANII